jgi:hypothetical protein
MSTGETHVVVCQVLVASAPSRCVLQRRFNLLARRSQFSIPCGGIRMTFQQRTVTDSRIPLVLFRIRWISDPSVIHTSAVIIILFFEAAALTHADWTVSQHLGCGIVPCARCRIARERGVVPPTNAAGTGNSRRLAATRVVPFFWLCGRFVFSEYKKMPGIYRAGTNVLRRNHTGTKTPKRCQE